MAQKTAHSFWSPVTTIAQARKVARQGCWTALLVAGITAAFAIASIALEDAALDLPINAWSFVDVVIFLAIAWGIYRLSRIAAVLGLVVYGLGQVLMWIAIGPQLEGIWLLTLIVFGFINGIRGTFTYHRLRREEA
jgi:hypothetical protein